jgi:hypothetical protein
MSPKFSGSVQCAVAFLCLVFLFIPLKVEPSPDPVALLKRSIEAMQRQDSLLAGYSYMKTVVTENLNDDLATTKREAKLVQVTSIPHGNDTEVLVAVNGKPISQKERQKREADQRERQAGGAVQPRLRADDLITQFDWSFEGSDNVNGRVCGVLSFRPKPGAVYKGSDPSAEKFLRVVAGRVWVDDEEWVITRMEFRSTGSVKSLGGLFWTVHSFSVTEERKRLDDGVWIDSTGEYFVDATALLVKSVIRRSTMWTHDYKKPGATPTQ